MSSDLQFDSGMDPGRSFLAWIAELGNGYGELLMKRMAHADREAFGEFYDITAARVLAIVSSVIDDAGLAEELTGEIFLEFWKTAPLHTEEFEPFRSVVLFSLHRARERLAMLSGWQAASLAERPPTAAA